MIKEKEQLFSYENEYIVPSHWKIREVDQCKKVDSSRIIPIGDGNEKFRELLIKAIQNAKDSLMLCSFILSDPLIIESILKACDKGVRCYLLFSTNAQLEKEFKTEQTEFDRKTLDEHKLMLDKLAGKALARTSDHLHAKFLLTDPLTSESKGFISTANFTKEALSRNQEIGVVLNKEEIAALFNLFRKGFWLESKNELVRSGHWDDVKTVKLKELTEDSRIFNTSYSTTTLRKEVSKLINNAFSELILSSYGFDMDHEVVQNIINSKKNIKTTILTRPREKNSSFVQSASKIKAKIFAYPYLHAKFVMDPNLKTGIIMTANFEKRGLDEGYEVGIKLTGNEYKELEMIFLNWIECAPLEWQDEESIQNLDPCNIQISSGKSIQKKEIIEEFIDDHGRIELNDLREMRKYLDEDPSTKENFDTIIPKKIVIKRTLVPPKLPDDAEKIDYLVLFSTKKERKQGKKIESFKFPFETYKLKNEYFVVLNSLKDLDSIQKYPKIKQNVKFVSKK